MKAPMIGPDISDEELKVFLQEAETLIESLDEDIVRLEQEGPSADLVQEIFRVAHTLKGSSGMLGFDEMARLTHSMEDLFDRVRKGTLSVSEPIIDALLMSLDGLKALNGLLASGGEIDVDIESMVAALQRSGELPVAAIDQHPRVLVERLAGDAAVMERVRSAQENGRAPLQITASIAPDSAWGAVRCFQVLNELDRFGEVLACVPTQAEIDAEQCGHLIEVLLEPGQQDAAAAIQQTIETLDEITSVVVAVFDQTAAKTAPRDAAETEPGRPAGAPAVARVEGLQNTIKIDLAQLDALMNIIGELVIDRTRVAQLSRVLGARFHDDDHVRALSETSTHIDKIVDELHARTMQIRLLPVGLLFSKFPRLVRDLSRSLAKSIRLEVEGEDTEIDRSVIDQMKDPLLHLIRNACDHGIETPAERQAAGKPELSVLRLVAKHEQGQVVISLTDDGRGIDTVRVKAQAVARGMISVEQAERMSEAEAIELIAEPGLSTATQTTEVSGRGVGLDIVRRDIESLGGRVEVESRRGEGTTFRLRLPLTLATFRGLLVGCGRATYAIPLSYVMETLRSEPGRIHFVSGRPVLHLRTRDTVMPVVWLDETLNAREPGDEAAREHPYLVVVRASDRESDRPVAIAVDRLVDQQDIVVKSLSASLGRPRGIAGASILGDGQVVLILDVPALINRSQRAELDAPSPQRELGRIAS